MVAKTGVLLAVSSLPSPFGIGDFGPAAYEFIDILTRMQIQTWQVLPLNPLGFGNSPYQTYSSFAGDILYISPELLVRIELLASSEISKINPTATTVDYPQVRQHKDLMLNRAFTKFTNLHHNAKLKLDYQIFLANTSWLTNYAVFATFKKINLDTMWTLWPKEHKNWIKDKRFDLTPYQQQIEYVKFTQFIFHQQWHELKNYANNRGIEIMGDLPIYLGLDSLDVWENQDMFLLDKQQKPTFVAGVPPDFFSATGHLWGNPVYNWEALQANNFKFWIERLRVNSQLFNLIRIDHFRAFDTYWKIPAKNKTAIKGTWEEAPGYALFDTIYQELPQIRIIAEDLGELRQEVHDLRNHYNLKGMKVFQFVFDPNSNNSEIKDTVNCVLYTGTHDNNTLRGWYNELSAQHRKKINAYFNCNATTFNQAVIKFLCSCSAEYLIIPIQDIIGLDKKARFNTPGQLGSPNWEWKLANFTRLKTKITAILG